MRLRRWIIAALSIGALSLPCQAEPLGVTGRILDRHGRPAAGARIELAPLLPAFAARRLALTGRTAPEPVATTATDAAGGFALAAPGPGMWMLLVRAPGTVPGRYDLAPLLEPEDLPDLRLADDAGVVVRVLDHQGRPVAGAQVASLPAPGERTGGTGIAGRLRPAPRLGTTGPDGRVRLPREAGESPRWTATAPSGERASVESGASAVVLRLPAGRPRPFEVVDAAGKPVAGALISTDDGPLGETDEQGRLTLSIPDGDSLPRLGLTAATADGRSGEIAQAERPGAPATGSDVPVRFRLGAPARPVEGRVLDRQSGQPLAGAYVWALEDPGAFVRADGKGGYRIAAPGAPRLAAAAEGHLSALEELAASRSGPSFALAPVTRVEGRVVDGAGSPVAGTDVSARLTPERGAHAGGWVNARSDTAGRFTLRRIALGSALHLKATHPDFAPAELDLPAPAPRIVRPELRLVLRPGRRLYGQVVDGAGRPVAGAELALLPASTGDLGSARADLRRTTSGPDGRFNLSGLGLGRFALRVRARGFAPARQDGIEIPAGAGGVDLGRVPLAPGAALRGQVSDPAGRPVGGAAVAIVPHEDGDRFDFFFDTATGETKIATQTGADGRFVLSEIAADRVDIRVSREGFLPVSLLDRPVPAPAPLAITLTPAGRLSGRVVDERGKPVPAVLLSLEGEGFDASASSDPEGRFAFPVVPAGHPTVRALLRGYLPSFLGPLDVVAGRELSGLEIVLERGASIEGRVVAPDGSGAPGAQVSTPLAAALLHHRRDGEIRVEADADGRYLLSGLPPGPRSITADRRGFARAVGSLDVRPGANHLDLQLGEGFAVTGRVFGDDGEPLPGVEVALVARDAEATLRQAVSDESGAFGFAGVDAGPYLLRAQKEGWASPVPRPLEVAGAPVGDLEVRLDRGGTVTGRILGLSPAAMAGVDLSASGNGNVQQGQVDGLGEYRISGLAPGTWSISARAGARHSATQITVPAAGAEVQLDLHLEGGLTLSGHLRRGGRPVPGATLLAMGVDAPDDASARAETDGEGAFRFAELPPGTYTLTALASGFSLTRSVELREDRTIDIEVPEPEGVSHRP
jgi:protocatechuate 3,4-dioxygenase beta subunit